MSTITSLNFDFPVKWAKDHLVNAQKQFNREPTGTHWNVCLRAMITHQQLGWALRSPHVDKDGLFQALCEKPIGEWQDAICRATLGLSCADALNQV